jgi:hypothetical protein
MIFRIYFFAHFINIFSEAISRFSGFRLSPHSFRTLRALPIGAKQRSTPSKAPALHRAYTIAKALKIIVTTIV